MKLKEGRFRQDTRKEFFMMRVLKHWHNPERWHAPPLETFKVRLSNLILI